MFYGFTQLFSRYDNNERKMIETLAQSNNVSTDKMARIFCDIKIAISKISTNKTHQK